MKKNSYLQMCKDATNIRKAKRDFKVKYYFGGNKAVAAAVEAISVISCWYLLLYVAGVTISKYKSRMKAKNTIDNADEAFE